jgi:hypothetical protein
MRRVMKRAGQAMAIVTLVCVMASCKTNPPAVNASDSTVAPSTTGAVAESSTTTTEEETTTTGKRFFSTTTDPDAPTTAKPKTTTTVKVTTTTRRTATTAKPTADYTPAMKTNFVDSCEKSSDGKTVYCNCVWDEITTTITFERFQEIEAEIKDGAKADSFPDLNAAIAACT